jgi:hypothetical protein
LAGHKIFGLPMKNISSGQKSQPPTTWNLTKRTHEVDRGHKVNAIVIKALLLQWIHRRPQKNLYRKTQQTTGKYYSLGVTESLFWQTTSAFRWHHTAFYMCCLWSRTNPIDSIVKYLHYYAVAWDVAAPEHYIFRRVYTGGSL